MSETVLYGSLGTLAVGLAYVIIKRLKTSTCHSESGCLQCDSPSIEELHKQTTERVDKHEDELKTLFDMLRKNIGRDPGDLENPFLTPELRQKEATILID
jgi:hypothetical protein